MKLIVLACMAALGASIPINNENLLPGHSSAADNGNHNAGIQQDQKIDSVFNGYTWRGKRDEASTQQDENMDELFTVEKWTGGSDEDRTQRLQHEASASADPHADLRFLPDGWSRKTNTEAPEAMVENSRTNRCANVEGSNANEKRDMASMESMARC